MFQTETGIGLLEKVNFFIFRCEIHTKNAPKIFRSKLEPIGKYGPEYEQRS